MYRDVGARGCKSDHRTSDSNHGGGPSCGNRWIGAEGAEYETYTSVDESASDSWPGGEVGRAGRRRGSSGRGFAHEFSGRRYESQRRRRLVPAHGDAAGTSHIGAFPVEAFTPPAHGPAPEASLRAAADLLAKAHLPVFFLGQRASGPTVVSVVRAFLHAHPIAVVETFQAAGAVPQDLAEEVFFGRVGLFRNQPGDRLLAHADLIVAIGYDPTEYDAHLWNPTGDRRIVHVDFLACDYGANYRPVLELLGSVKENVVQLSKRVAAVASPAGNSFCVGLLRELRAWSEGLKAAMPATQGPVHPLHFVAALQRRVGPDTTVACDVGTVYIYMMRYFRTTSRVRCCALMGSRRSGWDCLGRLPLHWCRDLMRSERGKKSSV